MLNVALTFASTWSLTLFFLILRANSKSSTSTCWSFIRYTFVNLHQPQKIHPKQCVNNLYDLKSPQMLLWVYSFGYMCSWIILCPSDEMSCGCQMLAQYFKSLVRGPPSLIMGLTAIVLWRHTHTCTCTQCVYVCPTTLWCSIHASQYVLSNLRHAQN